MPRVKKLKERKERKPKDRRARFPDLKISQKEEDKREDKAAIRPALTRSGGSLPHRLPVLRVETIHARSSLATHMRGKSGINFRILNLN